MDLSEVQEHAGSMTAGAAKSANVLCPNSDEEALPLSSRFCTDVSNTLGMEICSQFCLHVGRLCDATGLLIRVWCYTRRVGCTTDGDGGGTAGTTCSRVGCMTGAIGHGGTIGCMNGAHVLAAHMHVCTAGASVHNNCW